MSEFTAEFFENSSRRWRENKKQIDEGSFVYVCGALVGKNKYCQARVKQDPFCIGRCWRHKKK